MTLVARFLKPGYVAYVDRRLRQPFFTVIGTTGHIFIRARWTRGYYLRTHVSAGYVECPDCHAPAGAPCTGDDGQWKTDVHWRRRDAYKVYLRSKHK